MAKLTANKRKKLRSSSFVFPGERSFPINDISHARNALARASSQSPSRRAKIRAAVRRRFPSVQVSSD